jgi:hypothetical protein
MVHKISAASRIGKINLLRPVRKNMIAGKKVRSDN